MNKQTIIDYYDYTMPFYKWFWHRDGESNALHYGLWEDGVRNLSEALLKTNEVLAKLAAIKKGERVLDAGCGIGGSSIWLAKKICVRVTGITLSAKQAHRARALAKEQGVEKLIDFQVQDFTKTLFPDAAFDVAWAIESVCHADRKVDFLKEAYRTLKPGGRLIVADGFLARKARTVREKKLYEDFLTGFALPNVASVDDFRADMKSAGFSDVAYWDKTSKAAPSAKRVYVMCLVAYPLALLLEKIGVVSPILSRNNRTGISQYHLVKLGVAVYGIFFGKKK